MSGGRPVAEALAERIASLDAARLPAEVRETCERLLVDVVGLCLVARRTDYVRAALSAWTSDTGRATAIGHPATLGAAAAAFVNGTAAHGEDFDDTFEGGPVHAGAVVVPAVLAAAEQEGLGGASALLGIAVGVETICRLSLVVPKAVHKAGFHPTAVFGAVAAAAGVGSALRLEPRRLVDALGVSGSMAGGIIEYLAEGSWTKRMHPGWAAQSGLRAALLGRAGFRGPRTVFEGTHGLFAAFARASEGNYAALLDGFGQRWLMTALAFKPYPCGTMIQPYVDCARRLRKRKGPEDLVELVASVAEGTVHRLWEPLADKQRPPNGYAGKFSAPYCIASALVRGDLGLDAFTDEAVADARVRALAAKVRYEIDADNPYPFEYTGQLRVRLADGREIEERQQHLRGGAREPLTRADLEEKLRSNARTGGWPEDRIAPALTLTRTLWDGPVDLTVLRG
ncbi:MAG: MmgE/PrpD family protein [Myxococcales bacterium]